jgi:hypothetical protein
VGREIGGAGWSEEQERQGGERNRREKVGEE